MKPNRSECLIAPRMSLRSVVGKTACPPYWVEAIFDWNDLGVWLSQQRAG
ncbi:hypothetical protein [Crenothrix polyspora]|nr:hypothetical protein [Crenothrix polyspora]